MPPKHHHPPPHHKHRPPHSRAASLSFMKREDIDEILAPLLPDARERALVLRCVLDEGPAHHRGANWVLIKLLSLVAGDLAPTGESVPVPMRLPPHVAGHTDSVYPLRLPLAPLERLGAKGSAEVEAMIDCLLDGPPQHALANVIMVCLVDALLSKSGGAPPRKPGKKAAAQE